MLVTACSIVWKSGWYCGDACERGRQGILHIETVRTDIAGPALART